MKKLIKNERGSGLIEVLVALAILGLVAVVFLIGMATATKAIIIAQERTSAESLAKSQMEYAKQLEYVADTVEYPSDTIPPEYGGEYSATIGVEKLPDLADGGFLDDIQKLTVTINRDSKVVIKLEDYKVNR